MYIVSTTENPINCFILPWLHTEVVEHHEISIGFNFFIIICSTEIFSVYIYIEIYMYIYIPVG